MSESASRSSAVTTAHVAKSSEPDAQPAPQRSRNQDTVVGTVSAVRRERELRFQIDYRHDLKAHRRRRGIAGDPVTAGMSGHLLQRKVEFVVESVAEGRAIARVTHGRSVKHGEAAAIDVATGERDRRETARVQQKAVDSTSDSPASVRAIAARGLATPARSLPHADKIQAAFGPDHDISQIRAHIDPESTSAMGAEAYASGNDIVFAGEPDEALVAHEAAHVVQQAQGVNLKGGVGEAGDAHEQAADAVAARVTAGESAADLLGMPSAAGTSAVQMKQSGSLQMKPGRRRRVGVTVVSEKEAFDAVVPGPHAVANLSSALHRARSLYQTLIAQASAKATHEQHAMDYDTAKKAHTKALAPSDIGKVLNVIANLVEIGGGVTSILVAASALRTSARGLMAAYKMHKLTNGNFGGENGVNAVLSGVKAIGAGVKGANDVRKSGKEISSTRSDPSTLLPDVNAGAIQADNAALDQLTELGIGADFTKMHDTYHQGALFLGDMVKHVYLINKSQRALPESQLKAYETCIAECKRLNKQILSLTRRLEAAWKAYRAGGDEALANPQERTLFERIQHWGAVGDKRKHALRYSMDQSKKNIFFSGMAIDQGVGGSVHYYCHSYDERDAPEEGTLYVDDPAVAAELRKANLLKSDSTVAADLLQGGPGLAEQQEDKQGGLKFSISISMCKVLESMGVKGTSTQARVNLFGGNGLFRAQIARKRRGVWFEHWHDTPEFESFWRGELAAKYAYIKKPGEEKQALPFATDEDKRRSRAQLDPVVQG